MRTGVFIEHEEVLAVALEDVAPSLTYSSYEIKAALASGWGWSSTTKDFLRPGSVTISITRGISDRKRRCCGILLKKISEDQRKMIKKGWSFLENQVTVLNITTCV